jgi:ABC-type polysaccharide/polyol phosphate export permease/GT2 family glycosyltransferase
MAIKVAEFDIQRDTAINGLAGYDSVEILFRKGRNPLGRVRIFCKGDSVDLDELGELIKNLPKPVPLDIVSKKLPTVTVAICTRDRPQELVSALQSIAQQKYPADEILVIDNGCQNEVKNLVGNLHSAVRYIPERRKGLDIARNRAISEASGEIIAFMDDDAEADPFWVQSLAECFAAFPEAGTVAGLILPLELETEPQQLFEKNGGFARGFTRRILPRDGKRILGFRLPLVGEAIGAGSGCNMAFRTVMLKKLNGFDPALDTGSPLPGAGDLDIFYRMMRAGYHHIYEPMALVRHRHRTSYEGIKVQLAGYHRSLIAFLVKSLGLARSHEWFEIFIFLIWRLAKPGFRIIQRIIGRDQLPIGILLGLFIKSLSGLGSYHASKSRIKGQTIQHGGENPKLTIQLAELWRYRELIWNLTTRDLKIKYQRSWLGFIWTLLNPLITIGVLVTVFSYVVRIPIPHYWAFLLSGYFSWNYFSQTLNGGVQAAVGNAYLSRSAYFPQETLVISAALARLVEFVGELTIVMLFLVCFHHKGLPISFIMVFPLILNLFLLVIGISFCIVTVAVYYYDAIQAVSLATLALFYISPVFYSIDLVPESFRIAYLLNPMALLLGVYHDVLYWGKMPNPTYLVLTSISSLAFALIGYTVFNRKKREFAEII